MSSVEYINQLHVTGKSKTPDLTATMASTATAKINLSVAGIPKALELRQK